MNEQELLLKAFRLADEAGDAEGVEQLTRQLDALEAKEKQSSTSELVGVTTPASEKERSNWSYAFDQMKKRYGDWMDILVRGGMNTAHDPKVWNSMPPEVQDAVRQRVSENRSAELAPFGYQGLEPRTDAERFGGVVAAAAVDPLTLLPAGWALKGAGGATVGAKPYFMAAIEWATGTAAETAGFTAAESVGEAFKGTEYEDSTIDHIARIGSALVAGTLPAGAVASIRGGYKGFKAGQASLEGDVISDVLANTNVRAVLEKAVQSQGATFKERLEAVEELQKLFPDLVLPLVDAVGDNAILATEFRRLYSGNPKFQQAYDEASKKMLEQFEMYQRGLFPSPLKPGEDIRSPILEEANRRALQARAKGEEKLANIEAVRGRLARKYEEAPLAVNIEKSVHSIAEAAETAGREASKVYYDSAFAFAEAKGLSVPPKTVSDVWSFAEAQRKADLFADFPSLYRKIKAHWSPKEVEGGVLLGPSGQPLRQGGGYEFSEVSLRELDSLKRELNKAIRTTKDASKGAALRDLKDELDRQVKTIDPDFARMYKEADAKYYEFIGLPTSLEGYRSVDSARFSTTVSEALTRPDQIRDYLNFVGQDAGMDVVRDAMLMRARREILNSAGDVEPGKLRRFMARHREALEEVPEIRRMFEQDALLAERIARGQAKIDSTYNQYAKEQTEGFFKAITDKNLPSITNEMLSSPSSRQQYLKQINEMSPDNQKLALTGIRQSLLDKAMTTPNTTVADYITKHKAAFDEVFGAGYSESVMNLARLRDVINTNQKNLVSASISHLQDTPFREFTGLTFEETLGTLRNQIMSNARKVLHLGFKVGLTKTKEKADRALSDALLNPRALNELNAEAVKLLATLEQDTTGKVAGKAFLEFLKKFSTEVGGHVTLGGARGVSGSTIGDDLEWEMSLGPTWEEDDWLFRPQ